MLKRNVGVKEAPQRWQDNAADGAFDVVFTFEERVFNMVIDGTLPAKLFFCISSTIPDTGFQLFVKCEI